MSTCLQKHPNSYFNSAQLYAFSHPPNCNRCFDSHPEVIFLLKKIKKKMMIRVVLRTRILSLCGLYLFKLKNLAELSGLLPQLKRFLLLGI